MRGIVSYFIRSYRVTFLLIVSLAIYGAFMLFTLPREATPDIKIPIAVVVTTYPGASARDVEELVTKPIEDSVQNLTGLKQLTSSSQLGISTVTAEFNPEENLTEAIRRLRDEVQTIHTLPTDVETPQVIEINFQDQPIITVGVSGVNDERLLSLYAKQIADNVKTIPGVLSADIVGERTEQIGVHVQPNTLHRTGISLGQILVALKGNNINGPFGSVTTNAFGYELRLVERYENIADVAQTPIRLANGDVVPLSSIATVTQELSDSHSFSRISINGAPSTEAVSITIRKKTGGNILSIIDAVQKNIVTLQNTSLPSDVHIIYFADFAQDIRESLKNVTDGGLQTLLIVFCLLWLFLGWREALLASLSIPFTLSITFIVLRFTGTTLNNLSLFSLILALGLLVDDAIVIIDGIYARRVSSESLPEHAAQVVSQFFAPLTAGTLTTVSAFFPMLIVSGIIGQFLRTIPIVLTATLLSSLFVAVILIPPVAVKLFGAQKETKKERWFTIRFARFNAWYTQTIDSILLRRRFQNRFIATLVVLMVLGLSLPFTGILKTGLFPATDVDYIVGNIELPPGSTKEKTGDVMAKIEEILRSETDIASTVFNIGTSTSTDFNSGSSSSESLGSFSINLKPERKRTSIEITDTLRTKLASLPGGKITLTDASAGPPTSAAVELHVHGSDLHELDILSTRIMGKLSAIPGTINVDRDLKNSAGEFDFTLNRDALAHTGLSASDVAQTLRIAVFGVEATNFVDDNDDTVKVQLSAQKDAVNSIDAILSFPLQTLSGETIPLRQVIRTDVGTSINVIRHLDEKRTVTITAGARKNFNANEITKKLQDDIKAMGLPEGYTVTYGGEQQQTEETFTQLYQSMVIAIILILIIMVVEFNSFRQPFMMFLSIPLALIGVLFGLVLLHGELNFASFIGLVSLTGIVVKNAILLVDRMNAAREEGKSIQDAVRDAASSRFRPILLTTMATGLGLLPLVLVDAFFRDLALTIFTGLIFSTVLTLGLIPILYYRQQTRLEEKVRARIQRQTFSSI